MQTIEVCSERVVWGRLSVNKRTTCGSKQRGGKERKAWGQLISGVDCACLKENALKRRGDYWKSHPVDGASKGKSRWGGRVIRMSDHERRLAKGGEEVQVYRQPAADQTWSVNGGRKRIKTETAKSRYL